MSLDRITIEAMADFIATTEGKCLEEEFRQRLYRSMLRLGHEAPLHLIGRCFALGESKDKLHLILTEEKFQR